MKVANAPVSYGVFGLALPGTVLPDGEQLARLVHVAGYEGIDLGAPGLLGLGSDLTDRLARHHLGLAGGWVDLPFGAGTEEEFEAAFAAAREAMPLFVAGAQAGDFPAPKPTIADMGDDSRRLHPGGGEELELAPWQWDRFGERLTRVAELVRGYDLEPTFHHHACTFVETPAEIDQFLALGAMDLTFDSGHLLIGGGDPVRDIVRWMDRINHLHLKDADRSILAAAMGSEDPLRDVWSKRVFVPLGQGDLDVEAMMSTIMSSGFDGWLVVEQDVILQDEADLARAVQDQIDNRVALRRWLP